MERVFKLYENHFIFRKTHPNWSVLNDDVVTRCLQLIKSGYIYPLLERGSEGQKIVLMNQGKFDIENYSVDATFPLILNGLFMLLEDEHTQVFGIELIVNYTDVTLKYFSSFSLQDHMDFVQFGLKAAPGRFKKYYLVNMPAFASKMVSVVKLAMSEKMKSRLCIVKNIKELSKYVEVLPREMGGKIPESEMIESFQKAFVANVGQMKIINDFSFDLEKTVCDQKQTENVGSFRKLEID